MTVAAQEYRLSGGRTVAVHGNAFAAALFALSLWVPVESAGYSPAIAALRYLLYAAVAAVILIRGWRSAVAPVNRSAWPAGVPLAAFLFYVVASALWSDDLMFSAQRALLVAATALAAFVISSVFQQRDWIVLVARVSALFLFCGVVAVFLRPEIGIDHSLMHAGDWKGLSSQKNSFGLLGAIAAIVAIWLLSCQGSDETVDRYMGGLLAALGTICVIMSGSRGAATDLLVGVCVLAFFRLSRRLRRAIMLLGVLILPLLVVCLLAVSRFSGDALSVAGFEVGTTGRTAIWAFALEDLGRRVMFGFGFGGYWTEQRIANFEASYGWVLPNFHNGYVSLVIEGGIIGCFLFGCFLLFFLVVVVVRQEAIVRARASICVSLIVVFLVHNLYENSLLRSTDFLFLLFLLSAGRLGITVTRKNARGDHIATR